MLHTRWFQLWHSRGKEQIPVQTRKPQIMGNRVKGLLKSWFEAMGILSLTDSSEFGEAAEELWQIDVHSLESEFSRPCCWTWLCLIRTDISILRRSCSEPRGCQGMSPIHVYIPGRLSGPFNPPLLTFKCSLFTPRPLNFINPLEWVGRRMKRSSFDQPIIPICKMPR